MPHGAYQKCYAWQAGRYVGGRTYSNQMWQFNLLFILANNQMRAKGPQDSTLHEACGTVAAIEEVVRDAATNERGRKSRKTSTAAGDKLYQRS